MIVDSRMTYEDVMREINGKNIAVDVRDGNIHLFSTGKDLELCFSSKRQLCCLNFGYTTSVFISKIECKKVMGEKCVMNFYLGNIQIASSLIN